MKFPCFRLGEIRVSPRKNYKNIRSEISPDGKCLRVRFLNSTRYFIIFCYVAAAEVTCSNETVDTPLSFIATCMSNRNKLSLQRAIRALTVFSTRCRCLNFNW